MHEQRLWGRLSLARNSGGAPTPRAFSHARSLLRRGLDRILDRPEGGEFDVKELAVLLRDFADIDVLHDVARFRIDRDRTARALPGHALDSSHQRIAVGLAAGLLPRLVYQVHAVIGADRHEVRPHAVIGLLE